MTFTEYIKKRRLQLHLNQDEVPGFNQAYISKMETKKRPRPLKDSVAKALASAYHINLSPEWSRHIS